MRDALRNPDLGSNFNRAIYLANALENLLSNARSTRDTDRLRGTSIERELSDVIFGKEVVVSNPKDVIDSALVMLLISGKKENIEFTIKYTQRYPQYAISPELLDQIGTNISAFQEQPMFKDGDKIGRWSIAKDTIKRFKALK
jgi:hypothetical protein